MEYPDWFLALNLRINFIEYKTARFLPKAIPNLKFWSDLDSFWSDFEPESQENRYIDTDPQRYRLSMLHRPIM